MFCEKSIPILSNALAHEECLFFRNEGVPKYVPPAMSKYVSHQEELSKSNMLFGLLLCGFLLSTFFVGKCTDKKSHDTVSHHFKQTYERFCYY